MGKTWPALDIHVPECDPQLKDLVLAELDDFQLSAIHEPEDTPTLRAFFTTVDTRNAASRALAAAFGNHVFVEPIDVVDDDWAARSQSQLRAVTVGRVVIAPPWDIPEPERAEGKGQRATGIAQRAESALSSLPSALTGMQVVVIRPSMGFGTGHHATTRLMLRALQSLDLKNRRVFDIGCGSGVLAIAAVLLGARSALGVDIDPDALANAHENAELNAVGAAVRFEERDFREIASPTDIVLANLTGGLLESAAPTLAALVADGGTLIVSGLMESESTVLPSLERLLTLTRVDQEDEWRCGVFSR